MSSSRPTHPNFERNRPSDYHLARNCSPLPSLLENPIIVMVQHPPAIARLRPTTRPFMI